jgi:sugar diacid utilization regulator
LTGAPGAARAGPDTGAELRARLSNLQGLLVLSMKMTESGDEQRILHLATTAVPSLGHCRLHGVHLVEGGWRTMAGPCLDADVRTDLETQFAVVSSAGGAVAITREAWTWAFPLRSIEGHFGFMVVGSAEQPPESEQFMLRALAQQTGVALANARRYAHERAIGAELQQTNAALAGTVSALQRSKTIHERLTRVAVATEGQPGIAQALHELTGYAVAVEDRHGNLRAWAGPNRPDPYPKEAPARREQMLRRAQAEARPIREGERLLAVASPRRDVVGVLALVDPAGSAGEAELVALEHAATVLGMELARMRSLAETELRLRRDLVEELLAGTDDQSALARAEALGYDLERPHRVLVAEGATGRRESEDAFFHAVRRAVRDTGAGSLLVARGAGVVVLTGVEMPWEELRTAVLAGMSQGSCRLGVGGRCDRPADVPRSYREAQLALRMQHSTGGDEQATVFDDLGVYRILGEVRDGEAVQRFVRQWLGALIDYDEGRGAAELVLTLSRYLECGGNYDATATALKVHRSTLKYRLQRIREISGLDLGDPDTAFNLQLATRARQTLAAVRGEHA